MRIPFSKDVFTDDGDTRLTAVKGDNVRISSDNVVLTYNGGKTRSIPPGGLVQADADLLASCMVMLRRNFKEEFEDGTVTARFLATQQPETP